MQFSCRASQLAGSGQVASTAQFQPASQQPASHLPAPELPASRPASPPGPHHSPFSILDRPVHASMAGCPGYAVAARAADYGMYVYPRIHSQRRNGNWLAGWHAGLHALRCQKAAQALLQTVVNTCRLEEKVGRCLDAARAGEGATRQRRINRRAWEPRSSTASPAQRTNCTAT